MRPFTSTIPLEEAQRRLRAHVRAIERTERVDLASASGRVVARDVMSSMDVPPFSRSAMDGYAVVAADTAGASRTSPRSLRIVTRVYTGAPATVAIAAGECAEIATGAPLPDGADAVVMVEDTSLATGGDVVQIFASVAPNQNVGRRAADIAAGDAVVRAGDLLTPSRVGAVAAVGLTDIEVFTRPRVAIASTGNEVIDGGQPIGPGQIYDVNRYTLGAVVNAHGGSADPQPPALDTIDGLVAALDRCDQADIIVFSGGSSVGERDLIVDAIARRGELVFHGIAVKPGKPTAFATVRGVPFFGMPGNPTSCLSNAYILLLPFLRAVARLPPWTPRIVRVPLGRRIVSQAGRHQFFTVRLDGGAALPAFKGSGDITSLSRADGYIEIPATESSVDEGAIVDVTLF